jgi:hypothetical protein
MQQGASELRRRTTAAACSTTVGPPLSCRVRYTVPVASRRRLVASRNPLPNSVMGEGAAVPSGATVAL